MVSKKITIPYLSLWYKEEVWFCIHLMKAGCHQTTEANCWLKNLSIHIDNDQRLIKNNTNHVK